jgi:hypothetical protein
MPYLNVLRKEPPTGYFEALPEQQVCARDSLLSGVTWGRKKHRGLDKPAFQDDIPLAESSIIEGVTCPNDKYLEVKSRSRMLRGRKSVRFVEQDKVSPSSSLNGSTETVWPGERNEEVIEDDRNRIRIAEHEELEPVIEYIPMEPYQSLWAPPIFAAQTEQVTMIQPAIRPRRLSDVFRRRRSDLGVGPGQPAPTAARSFSNPVPYVDHMKFVNSGEYHMAINNMGQGQWEHDSLVADPQFSMTLKHAVDDLVHRGQVLYDL